MTYCGLKDERWLATKKLISLSVKYVHINTWPNQGSLSSAKSFSKARRANHKLTTCPPSAEIKNTMGYTSSSKPEKNPDLSFQILMSVVIQMIVRLRNWVGLWICFDVSKKHVSSNTSWLYFQIGSEGTRKIRVMDYRSVITITANDSHRKWLELRPIDHATFHLT